MDDIALPPELEQFVADIIAAGRYRDRAAVFAAAVGLVRKQETARAAFVASLEAADAEGERNGFHTIDDVNRELDDIIAKAERKRA